MSEPAALRDEPWTIRRLIGWTQAHFDKRGIDSPRLTAELLLGHTLRASRVTLYSDFERVLSKEELAGYRALIERRLAGEPTHYLLGAKDFYNHSFKIDARVLVPRPETELLVQSVLRLIEKDAAARVLDVCTGSGCIAISIAAERPRASVWATDLSSDACAVATENVEAIGVGSRVTVREGDLLAPVPEEMRFDVIVSNPPYVASGDINGLSREVRREPRLALDGGPEGMDLIRRLIASAPTRLKPGGWLAMEIGETQGTGVRQCLLDAGYVDVRIDKDMERRDRHAFARLPGHEAGARLPTQTLSGGDTRPTE